MQFLGGLVHAHDRSFCIIRSLVDVEDVLHLGYEPGTGFADAPTLDLPRLKFAFFKCL